ncbi:hypothetical protein PENSPDRAFT_112228 [Peniophora sp. CONT]|nr:hypothetical protein PENSPDRAFT_112228 [Peniophora sp. CONT]
MHHLLNLLPPSTAMKSSDEDAKNSRQEPQSEQDTESILRSSKVTTALTASQSQTMAGGTREEVEDAEYAQPSEAQEVVKEEGQSLPQWREKTRRWIRNVNSEEVDKVVEVGDDETLLAGDVELAKGDDDEFELYITGAKPGIWRMSHSASSESHVQFIWVREGTVDYDELPPSNGDTAGPADDDDAVEWEEIGAFSIDSGVAGLFSQSVFNSLTRGGKRQYKIEVLLNARMNRLGYPYVPGGIIIGVDDGGYVVEGIRDGDGKIVLIRLHETREG